MSVLLRAEELGVSAGERLLLSGVSFSVGSGERLALLGRNGAGKTTLLRVLAGARRPEEGTVWRQDGLRVGVLDQQPVFAAGVSVLSLLDASDPHRQQQDQLDALAPQLGDPEVLERWTQLQQQHEQAGAYRWRAEAERTFFVLELGPLLTREAATLSGGERTRLALALALARSPELLLLDEPTNHLDIRMREWLEDALRCFPGGVVLTSHDRAFLDRVMGEAGSGAAGRSLWLEGSQGGGRAGLYPGGYTRARQLRELERRTRERAHQLGRREERRLSGSADQLELWGQRSRAVRARLARAPVSEAPQAERAVRMRLLAGQARARLLLWAEHVGKRYGEREVLADAAFKIRQGDRVALMGANGTGKTTLLRLLSGESFPDPAAPGEPVPSLQLAAGVQVVTLDQTWHGLDPDRGLHEQFGARFGGQANALLGRAGFREDDWPRTPHELSGGERARAGLALVSALRADLLLLDEPTNHLDVEALEALEAAVQAYRGAVVIVTHDRRFAEHVATRLWLIEDARLRELGGWNERGKGYLDPARTLEGDPPPPPPPPDARERLRRAEDRLNQLDAQLDTPGLTQREEGRLRAERHTLRARVDELYADVYSAPVYDGEVRSGGLRVRAQRFEGPEGIGDERGGMFWAAHDLSCPHLAWDGTTLRWSVLQVPGWYGAALLGGALQLLFLRWNVGRVRLGEGGPPLSRRAYFERLGYPRPASPGAALSGPALPGPVLSGPVLSGVEAVPEAEAAPLESEAARAMS